MTNLKFLKKKWKLNHNNLNKKVNNFHNNMKTMSLNNNNLNKINNNPNNLRI